MESESQATESKAAALVMDTLIAFYCYDQGLLSLSQLAAYLKLPYSLEAVHKFDELRRDIHNALISVAMEIIIANEETN